MYGLVLCTFQRQRELIELPTALKRPLGHINQETFPLPTLHATLRGVSRELHHGRGFQVLRGLPVWKHGREDNIIMYAGVSSHIAPIRGRQDKQFEGKPADVVLAHIKDLSTTADKDRIGSPAYTAEKQVFHTDAGDVVSLLALSVAAEGGQSWLSSSWKVYNELAKSRPDLITTLAQEWVAEKSVLVVLARSLGALSWDTDTEQFREPWASLPQAPAAALPACIQPERRKDHHPVRPTNIHWISGPATISKHPANYRSPGRSTRRSPLPCGSIPCNSWFPSRGYPVRQQSRYFPRPQRIQGHPWSAVCSTSEWWQRSNADLQTDDISCDYGFVILSMHGRRPKHWQTGGAGFTVVWSRRMKCSR